MLNKIAFALGLLLMVNVEAVTIQTTNDDEGGNEDNSGGDAGGDTGATTEEECTALKDELMISTGDYSFNGPCGTFTAVVGVGGDFE